MFFLKDLAQYEENEMPTDIWSIFSFGVLCFNVWRIHIIFNVKICDYNKRNKMSNT